MLISSGRIIWRGPSGPHDALGPPCYFENRKHFADADLEEMHEHREVWLKERASVEALLRGR